MKKLLIIITLAISAMTMMADEFKIGKLTFETTSSTEVELTKADKDITTVFLSETITYNRNTYSVTSIGEYAFRGCTALISIAIPKSVASIGGEEYYHDGRCDRSNVFENCPSLRSIIVAGDNPVYDSRNNCNAIIHTAENYLIAGCSHTTIPNSVTWIAPGAFEGCSSLTSITIPNSVTSIGERAFKDCKLLRSVTIPNSVNWIGVGAFYGCSSLTSVTIPESVMSIGEEAFHGCSSLTSITIPKSVTRIGITGSHYNLPSDYGSNVFADCPSLRSIIVADDNPVYDSRNNCNAIINTETNTLLAGCSNTTIPNGVTAIGYIAFDGCSSLTSVTIPNTVTCIETSAFAGCSSLRSITIPNSVTRIYDGAFEGCSSLSSVTIPSSVIEIGISYFNYDNEPDIGSNVFADCPSLRSIIVASDNPVYDSRNNCNAIIHTETNTLMAGCANTTIPYGVKEINYSAFDGCSSLTSVTIPNSMTRIGHEAFAGCSSLRSVTIPKSVKSIGDLAFYGCASLKSVTIPTSVTWIGERAIPKHTKIIHN